MEMTERACVLALLIFFVPGTPAMGQQLKQRCYVTKKKDSPTKVDAQASLSYSKGHQLKAVKGIRSAVLSGKVGLMIAVEPRWAELFLAGTDRKGRARLWGIPPGSQMIRVAHAEGYREVKQSVILTAGKLMRVKILLDRVNN